MPKLTLKKIAENTLRKVGKPLTTKEIWEVANRLGTIEDFVSEGKTPDATIGAYIYWSLRDNEGIFTKEEGRPRRFGLTAFHKQVKLQKSEATVLSNEDIILNDFLDKWSIDRVKKMTLTEYNKQGSKETFCYMLEYGTRQLGNISGTAYSSKFEIYERKDKENIPKSKDYGYDDNYTWRNRGGAKKTREEAFEYTKNCIISIIEAVQNGEYHKIDTIGIAPLVVWKIAFIYSDKKLLSISDRKAVRYLGELFNIPNYEKAKISELHSELMNYVKYESFWNDMHTLWSLYQQKDQKNTETDLKGIINREGVTLKDIEDSIRKQGIKDVIITKKHNRLQQNLFEELVNLYGKNNVIMEKHNIDIKVEHPNQVDLYEVKIASSAKYCIRYALGQIIEYAYNYNTTKVKNLIIVGNHKLAIEDIDYVKHIKTLLVNVNFDYQHYVK